MITTAEIGKVYCSGKNKLKKHGISFFNLMVWVMMTLISLSWGAFLVVLTTRIFN